MAAAMPEKLAEMEQAYEDYNSQMRGLEFVNLLAVMLLAVGEAGGRFANTPGIEKIVEVAVTHALVDRLPQAVFGQVQTRGETADGQPHLPLPGKGKKLDVVSAFQSYGQFLAGSIDEDQRQDQQRAQIWCSRSSVVTSHSSSSMPGSPCAPSRHHRT